MKKLTAALLTAFIALSSAMTFAQTKSAGASVQKSGAAARAKSIPSANNTNGISSATQGPVVPGLNLGQQGKPGEDLRRYLQPPATTSTPVNKQALQPPPPPPNSGPRTPYVPAANPIPLPKVTPAGEVEEDPDNLIRQWNQQSSMKDRKRAVRDALAMRPASAVSKPVLPTGLPTQGAQAGPVTNAWSQIGYGDYNLDTIHHRAGRIRQASYAYDSAQGTTTLWLGAAAGGLWRGVYLGLFGVAFVPMSDNLPGSPSVGAFAIQPGNSNNILIGSGDLYRYGGSGMYKTTDGGATWTAVNPTDGTTWPDSFQKVLVDAGDPSNQTVLAAGTAMQSGKSGIWRSTDFGSTWTQVYNGAVTDLVQDPVNTYIWYAGAPGIGVLRSTSYGSYYAPIGSGMNAPGRVGVAVSAAAPWHVYAISATVAPNGVSSGLAGIWRSDSYGDGTWTAIETTDKISGQGQAFHTTTINVDPTNADIVFAGMTQVEVTYNATQSTPTWKYSPGDFDDGHSDHTQFVFEPGSTTVIAPSDGGVYVIDENALTMSASLNYATNLNVQQEFQIGSGDLSCSLNVPDQCLVGLQDNAVVAIDRYTNPPLLDVGLGGDGGSTSISPDNSAEMFAMENGARFYSFSPFASWYGDFGNCFPGGSNFYATTMLDQTPATNFSPFIYTNAGPYVWYKGVDPNCDWSLANSNTAPLPAAPFMMDASNDPSAYVFYTVPWNSGKLYVMDSYSDGPIGAMTYEDRTPPLPFGSKSSDSRVSADRSSLRPYTVTYVTSTSTPAAAFLSNDRGQSWTNVTGDLATKFPKSGAFFLQLVANPGDQSNLFLATTVGIYRSDNGGVNWYPYMDGLPAVVSVNDVRLNYDYSNPPLLHIGTFGRGFWDRYVAPDSVVAGSSITPSTFVGGHSVDYVVWLDRPAPVDTTISLTSSNPSVFPVPATVTIAAGYSNAGIVVTTPNVTTTSNIQLTAKYNAVTQVANAVVTPPNPTTTAISSSLNPSVYGQSVTFTSQTSSQVAGTLMGVVIFYDGANPLGPPVNISNGNASITVSNLDAYTHSVNATYNGDSNYAISTSPVLPQTVNPASTSTTITASPNPSVFGQPVTMIAAVNSSAGPVFTGSVQFFDGTALLGAGSVNGSGIATFATSGFAVGNHSLTAEYVATTDFNASTSAPFTQKVGPATTKTALQASPNPSRKGQPVTLTATVTPQYPASVSGTVTFKDGSKTLGTVSISSNRAILTTSSLAIGNHSLTAIYAGNQQFKKSNSPVVKEVITK